MRFFNAEQNNNTMRKSLFDFRRVEGHLINGQVSLKT